jgi:hypothetical protein
MRLTVIHIRGGQPRAYADSEQVNQLKFEYQPWIIGEGHSDDWEPAKLTPERVIEWARVAQVGYTNRLYGERREGEGMMEAAFATYLDYIREVSPGVWEIRTVSPYTD